MHDALVIGSGPNGLAAAIRLAEAGLDVLVLEAAEHAGGAVRTQALTLPGFRHDTFSSVYPAGAASPVWARMPLREHGLEWVQPEAASAHVLPEGRAAVLYRDVGRTAASLDALHPGDGEAWARFAMPFLEHFGALRDTMLAGFPPLGGPLELLARSPRAALDLTRMLTGSAVGLGRRLFASDGSRAWLYSAAGHGDAPPGAAGSAIAAFYLNVLGHAVGWPSPRGGAQALTDALVAYLRRRGGDVRTSAPVERIETTAGRVSGVRLAGGETLAAPLVIATVMPQALLRMAPLRGWYRAALTRFTPGPTTTKVDWALDGPIPWLNAAARGAGTVHVGGTGEEMLARRHPFLLLGQQSVADPTRAPAGRHTAWAYTHPATDAERIEAQVERFAPGFRDRILARSVLGPAELEARDANLIGGDVGAGSYRLRQVVFRPVPKRSPYTTPLDGLFIGGASTFPGGAVHGVPGDAAARAALRSA
jgi:phytoene dehydrogenase-like protein